MSTYKSNAWIWRYLSRTPDCDPGSFSEMNLDGSSDWHRFLLNMVTFRTRAWKMLCWGLLTFIRADRCTDSTSFHGVFAKRYNPWVMYDKLRVSVTDRFLSIPSFESLILHLADEIHLVRKKFLLGLFHFFNWACARWNRPVKAGPSSVFYVPTAHCLSP